MGILENMQELIKIAKYFLCAEKRKFKYQGLNRHIFQGVAFYPFKIV
jgi:hypothetical protein